MNKNSIFLNIVQAIVIGILSGVVVFLVLIGFNVVQTVKQHNIALQQLAERQNAIIDILNKNHLIPKEQ